MSPFIDDNDIDRVREAVNIAEVIGDYLTLKRKSQGDYWGLCPFHTEKTPSFHVRIDRGIFHCFGCGKGGNVFTFLMEVDGVSFADAVKTLADRVGIEIVEQKQSPEAAKARTERERLFQANGFALRWFHNNLIPPGNSSETSSEGVRALDYLLQRGITTEIIEDFQLGWADLAPDNLVKASAASGIGGHVLTQAGLAYRQSGGVGFRDRFRGRVIFPIVSLTGKAVAFGARRIEGITPESDEAKYINSAETSVYRKSQHLYGLNVARTAIRREKTTYLVEGYTDLLAMVRAGYENTTASLGTALTVEQANLIKRFTSKVHIVYDADNAGVAAALRGADILIKAGLEVRMILLPEGDDPDTLLETGGIEALKTVLAADLSFVEFRLQAAKVRKGMSPSELMSNARGLIETIGEIEDLIQRDILVNELSASTGISPTAIYKALEIQPRRMDTRETKPNHQELMFDNDQKPERDLMKALAGHPELIGDCLTEVSVDMISHPGLKKLFLELEKEYLSGKEVNVAGLPEKTNNPAMRSFITQAVMWGENVTRQSAEEEIRGCLHRLLVRDLKRRKIALDNKLKKTGPKDTNHYELKHEYNEIVKKLYAMEKGDKT